MGVSGYLLFCSGRYSSAESISISLSSGDDSVSSSSHGGMVGMSTLGSGCGVLVLDTPIFLLFWVPSVELPHNDSGSASLDTVSGPGPMLTSAGMSPGRVWVITGSSSSYEITPMLSVRTSVGLWSSSSLSDSSSSKSKSR